MSHLATRKVNTFQRGYSMQMVQVLQGHNYVLTKSELDNTIVCVLPWLQCAQISTKIYMG